MDKNSAKDDLIKLVEKYVDENKKKEIIQLIDNHCSVPIRGVFDEIVKGKIISKDDRDLLDDMMHFFG
ncbi:MAG: hypothetical protein OQK95_12530 [Gammaproteobacteria bacterium]|nr:hypothetical protein [Gammaproteobacteria bacterium]